MVLATDGAAGVVEITEELELERQLTDPGVAAGDGDEGAGDDAGDDLGMMVGSVKGPVFLTRIC